MTQATNEAATKPAIKWRTKAKAPDAANPALMTVRDCIDKFYPRIPGQTRKQRRVREGFMTRCRAIGLDTPINQISDADEAQFMAVLAERGVSLKIAAERWARLKALIRRAWPEHPGIKPRWANHPQRPGRPAPEPGSVAEFFERVYRVERLPGRSPRTVALYRQLLTQFDQFLGHRAMMAIDLTDDNLRGFIDWFLNVRKAKIPTADRGRESVAAIWRFACRKGLLTVWPTVPAIHGPTAVPRAWSKEELARLWEACARQPGTISGIPAGQWWLCLHSVIWDTGERIGAVLLVEWNDVELDRGWITFRGETRKGGREPNVCKLHPDTVIMLRRLPRAGDLVFPWDRCRVSLWYRYRKIRERANLPTDRRSAFHRIRRSVASWAEAAGANSTAMLGHSRRSVTERSYLDPTIVPKTTPVDVLFRIPSADAGKVGASCPQ